MQEYIFTSNRAIRLISRCVIIGAICIGSIGAFIHAAPALAADKTTQLEEEDFSSSPYTDYGEFNEESDEEAETKFFQHGRFFGVSLGLGFQTADGNRGLLYQGGFPVVDFKIHYWFDFNLALDLGMFTASHFYLTSTSKGPQVTVSMIHVGVDVKYYFDTKDVAAPISFASPYILLGGGSFSKTETSFSTGLNESDSGTGLSVGGGLEFAIRAKKVYFELEGKAHIVTFNDNSTTEFTNEGKPDLRGNFYTMTGSVLFTW